jgi:hypothetical protein
MPDLPSDTVTFLCFTISVPMSPQSHGRRTSALFSRRKRLGPERYAQAWATGQVLTLEQAVAEALDREPVLSASTRELDEPKSRSDSAGRRGA